MKWHLVSYLVGLIFLSVSETLAVCDSPKVAYIQIPGQHPKETHLVNPYLGNDLGLKLSALGYKAVNIFERIEKGRCNLDTIKILIFASSCTRSHGVDAFRINEQERLRDFVGQGGCILMFAQGEHREYEHVLPLGMNLVRSRNEYDRIGHIERKHPIFSRPHAISHRRLNELWENKFSLNSLSRRPFRHVFRGHVLAAQDKEGHEAFCVEFGWGKGRVLFFACAPEGYEGDIAILF